MRGPYLEGVGAGSLFICWRTDIPARGFLEIEGGGARRSFAADAARQQCVEVEGLSPATPHRYRIATQDAWQKKPVWSRWHRFDPVESPGAGLLRFAVLADAGWGEKEQWAVARRLAVEAPPFLLFAGDVTYPSGADQEYDDGYFRPYGELLSRMPVYIAVGNHDYGNYRLLRGAGAEWIRDNFFLIHRLPRQHPPASSGRTYYSFDRGPAHFVVLDSNRVLPVAAAPPLHPGSPQWRWLEEDLAGSKALWKFVLMHVPVYSSGQHRSMDALARWLAPLFERHGVDVVFQGHDHDYERTFPIVGGRRSEKGPVYVTAGIGGAPLRGRYRVRPWSAAFASRHGFVDVTIKARTLTLRGVATDGEVFDRWETSK